VKNLPFGRQAPTAASLDAIFALNPNQGGDSSTSLQNQRGSPYDPAGHWRQHKPHRGGHLVAGVFKKQVSPVGAAFFWLGVC